MLKRGLCPLRRGPKVSLGRPDKAVTSTDETLEAEDRGTDGLDRGLVTDPTAPCRANRAETAQ
jgi:hypothetical protein